MITRLLLFTEKDKLGDIAMIDLNGPTEFTGIPGSYNGECGLMCVYNFTYKKFIAEFQKIVSQFLMFIVDTSEHVWIVREVANGNLSNISFSGSLDDLNYHLTEQPDTVVNKYLEIQEPELSFSIMCVPTHDLLVNIGAIRGLTMQQQTEIMVKKVKEEAERYRASLK